MTAATEFLYREWYCSRRATSYRFRFRRSTTTWHQAPSYDSMVFVASLGNYRMIRGQMREAIETIGSFGKAIGLEKERRDAMASTYSSPKAGPVFEWPSCRSDTVMHDPVHIAT